MAHFFTSFEDVVQLGAILGRAGGGSSPDCHKFPFLRDAELCEWSLKWPGYHREDYKFEQMSENHYPV